MAWIAQIRVWVEVFWPLCEEAIEFVRRFNMQLLLPVQILAVQILAVIMQVGIGLWLFQNGI